MGCGKINDTSYSAQKSKPVSITDKPNIEIDSKEVFTQVNGNINKYYTLGKELGKGTYFT
jgi:hypothetical protein